MPYKTDEFGRITPPPVVLPIIHRHMIDIGTEAPPMPVVEFLTRLCGAKADDLKLIADEIAEFLDLH